MATNNTLEDLGLAVLHLDYMSRRASAPEVRARAQILVGLIRLLDPKYPTWKQTFLADLAERGETRSIQDLIVLKTITTSKDLYSMKELYQTKWENRSEAQKHASDALALKAVHVIDNAFSLIMDATQDRQRAVELVCADWRVRDAVTTLAALGYDQDAFPDASVIHRLRVEEFVEILVNALGHTLIGITRSICND